MATQTTNYGLTKPSYNETADIGVINSNMDIIDAKMKAIENKAGSGGGGGNTDTYGHVKVGSVTIDASGDDTIELVAGSNVTLTPDTTSKSVTISATGSGGGGTSDYLQLSNKPKINGIELVGNVTAEGLGIVVPQYTSELVNDSGFITNETDPTVPAWAKEPTKPTYTAEEVGALPSNTPIPDPTSVVVDRFVSVGTHIADISVNGEKTELYAPTGGGGTSVTVDSELSTTSENPVQNKVITQALNEKSNLISDAWNASTTYAVGQYCIYNNSLWKCLVQHSGQTPTEGTYWTNVSVANEITSVNNSIQETTNRLYWKKVGTATNSISVNIPSEARTVCLVGYQSSSPVYKNPLGVYPIDLFPDDNTSYIFTSGGLGNVKASMSVVRFAVKNKAINVSYVYTQGSSGSEQTSNYKIDVFYC